MKNLKCLGLTLVAIIFMTGCGSTPEQRARYAQEQRDRAYLAQVERQKAQERWMDGLKDKCANYGFKQGTSEFSQCLMQTDQQQRAANAAWFAEQDRQREQLFQTARDLAKPPAFIQPSCPANTNNNSNGSRMAGC
jgi:hypothetical protein